MADQWNPTAQYLPYDDQDVLITYVADDGTRRVSKAYCDGVLWWNAGPSGGLHEHGSVVAWMQIPAPYQG